MKHITPYHFPLNESAPQIPEEAIEILNQAVSGDWHLNPSGVIDVEGNCDFTPVDWQKVSHLFEMMREGRCPKFGTVTWDFICSQKALFSLEGCPTEVGGDFRCHNNYLTSLEGGPLVVKSSYICTRNPLKSLKGAPLKVGGNFSASHCKLKNLEGAPQSVGGEFSVDQNQLEDLKGAPQHVKGLFSCRFNKDLVSLEGLSLASDSMGHFVCDWLDVGREAWPVGLLFVALGKSLSGVKGISVRGDWERAQLLATSLVSSNLKGIDSYFLKNPLDLDLLDPFPDIKAEVLRRTGLKDLSGLARSIRRGTV